MGARYFWTNSSVLQLEGRDNPVEAIAQKARDLVLDFVESGGSGPPFDPFELAKFLKLRVRPSEETRDARTFYEDGGFQIEYNPTHPRSRIWYSISHEIVHTLFPDCKEEVRNRATHEEMRSDTWQLEMLCNIGAAEILMPIGSFLELGANKVSIEDIVDMRKEFNVSFESLFLRFIKLTKYQCTLFSASRPNPEKAEYKLDYVVPSNDEAAKFPNGMKLPADSIVGDCTGIGYTAKKIETWRSSTGSLQVECVGIPAYPGQMFPRVMGLLWPPNNVVFDSTMPLIVRGDATRPRGKGNKIIAFVVNDKTPRWGAGFALEIKKKWPNVQEAFVAAMELHPAEFRLGRIFTVEVDHDVMAVMLIAQHGYGPSRLPRIRYAALQECLTSLAKLAKAKLASIHMPRIGSGQAGGNWSIISEMIGEVVSRRGVLVTIYDLPDGKPQRSEQAQLLFAK